jgi:hypothetical protein
MLFWLIEFQVITNYNVHHMSPSNTALFVIVFSFLNIEVRVLYCTHVRCDAELNKKQELMPNATLS